MFAMKVLSAKTEAEAKAEINALAANQWYVSEVIDCGHKGFFGIGSRPAQLKYITGGMIADELGTYAHTILAQMGMTVTELTTSMKRKTIQLQIETDQNGLLIGRNGETLAAFQYVLGQALKKHLGQHGKLYVEVNVANYREQVVEKLQRQAMIAARKAHKTQQAQQLPAMSASERKIVHTALMNDQFVKTVSVGSEPNRAVRIELRTDVPQRRHQQTQK